MRTLGKEGSYSHLYFRLTFYNAQFLVLTFASLPVSVELLARSFPTDLTAPVLTHCCALTLELQVGTRTLPTAE